VSKLPPEALEFFREQGAKGGRKGGKRRLETLTAEQRSEFAKKAAAARWKGVKPMTRTAKAKQKP